MKTKGVAFNLDDPDQKELFEWAMSRTNFSAYVKRLIQADREQKTRILQNMQMIRPEPSAQVNGGGHTVRSDHGGIKIRIGE